MLGRTKRRREVEQRRETPQQGSRQQTAEITVDPVTLTVRIPRTKLSGARGKSAFSPQTTAQRHASQGWATPPGFLAGPSTFRRRQLSIRPGTQVL
jgi:hypothetical protein